MAAQRLDFQKSPSPDLQGSLRWPRGRLVASLRRGTKFLFECWKTFHEWALLSNCFVMNLKLQNAAKETFCLCWVLRSKIALMRCVTFSNVLHVFGLFMIFLHFSMGQQICIRCWNHKICRKATTVGVFSIFTNLMSNGIQVPSEFFSRTKFFPTSWSAGFSQVWRRSIFKFCVYKLAEAVRYLKFK